MSVPPLPEGDLAWNYFPDNYRWSHGMLIALGGAPWGGAEIGEVHRVGLRLQSCVGDDLAWFRAWAHEADRLIEDARDKCAKGRTHTAVAQLLRAAHYHHVGERFMQPKTNSVGCRPKPLKNLVLILGSIPHK